MDKELVEYFNNRVIKNNGNGCWVWVGSLTSTGYGVVSFKGKKIPAHRVSLMIDINNNITDKTIFHSCANRQCVNPDHLYIGNTKIDKICEQCGRIFGCRRDRINTSKTCSVHCRCVYAGNIGRQKQLELWAKDSREEMIKKMRLSFEKFFDKSNDCWNWTGGNKGPNRMKYGSFTFRGKGYLAHRASYVIYKDEIPEGMLILHKCDNPSCVNPDHLYLGTYLDNQRDKLARGRCKVEKLTIEQVKEIRKKLSQGVTSKKLAKDYGVSTKTLHSIKSGKTWRDV